MVRCSRCVWRGMVQRAQKAIGQTSNPLGNESSAAMAIAAQAAARMAAFHCVREIKIHATAPRFGRNTTICALQSQFVHCSSEKTKRLANAVNAAARRRSPSVMHAIRQRHHIVMRTRPNEMYIGQRKSHPLNRAEAY